MQSLDSSAKLLTILLIAFSWIFIPSNGLPAANRLRRQTAAEDLTAEAISVDAAPQLSIDADENGNGDDISLRFGNGGGYHPYNNGWNYPAGPGYNFPPSYGQPSYSYPPPGEQYNYSGGYGSNNNNNNGYYNYMYPNTTTSTTSTTTTTTARTTTTTPTTTTTRPPYGNYYVFNFRDGSQNNTGDAIYADPSNDGFTFGSR